MPVNTGFPKDRNISITARVIVSVLVAAGAMFVIWNQYRTNLHTDFFQSWFGAKSILQGVNPYALLGHGKVPGYSWTMNYPATSFIPVIPFAFLSERWGAVVFVGVSSFLLCFGVTRQGWYLLPIFLSESYMNGARLGQWNIVLTAALFFPWLAFLSASKPQTALPVLFGNKSLDAWMWAIVGGGMLLLASFVLLPGWPRDWLVNVRAMKHSEIPVMQFGGFLILSVLIKWRRPEARMILALSLIPQTMAWYSTLPLFTIPKSFRQSVFLVGVAQVGGYLGALLIPDHLAESGFYSFMGGLHVWTMYLPAVLLVLFQEPTSDSQRRLDKPRTSGNSFPDGSPLSRLSSAKREASHA